MLAFQRLDVYQAAIELLGIATTLAERVPRGYFHLADQLRRAALSVPLNIGEASGRTTRADMARHYAIARGSAMECAAVVDTLRVLAAIDAAEQQRAMLVLERVVGMLTKLCR